MPVTLQDMIIFAAMSANVVLSMLMGPRKVPFLALLGLFLLGLFFYWAAMGKRRLCRVLVISLITGGGALFLIGLAGAATCLGLHELAMLPQEVMFEVPLPLLATGILSNAGAVLAFGGVFWYQISRHPKGVASNSPASTASEGGELTAEVPGNHVDPLRVIAGFLTCACVAGASYAIYCMCTPLQTTPHLIDRCMNEYEQSLIDDAVAELKRRGPKTVPAIAEALQSVTFQTDIGFGPRRPNPRYLFYVLAHFNTAQAVQLLRDWAASPNRAPEYRYYAFEAIIDTGDDYSLALVDDLLRDETETGCEARKWFLGYLKFSDHPNVLASAIPYLRLEVDNIAAKEDAAPNQIDTCARLLQRIGTPEALELLVRMASLGQETRQCVEEIVGAELLPELVKK